MSYDNEQFCPSAQPDPLFADVDDEHLLAGAEGCTELSCIYHRRVLLEVRRRARSNRPGKQGSEA